MLYLIASLIALLAGPLSYRYLTSDHGLQKGLDGFIFVSLGGLVLIHILPELLERGGWLSLLFVVTGVWGPAASERLFHRYSDVTRKVTVCLGVFGLLLHTVTDGGALVLAAHPDNSDLLALGVILHRLPVGIAVWWLLKPQIGSRNAAVVLAVMMLSTAAGYMTGQHWLSVGVDNTVYLQAFVTGSILHVVLHQSHIKGAQDKQGEDKQGKYEYQAAIGSILGIVLLILLLSADQHSSHFHDPRDHQLHLFWRWLVSVSPAVLLCLSAAALRYGLNIKPDVSSDPLGWLQKIAGPEMWLFSFLVLGPEFFYIHFLISVSVIAALTLTGEKPRLSLPRDSESSWHFAFAGLIDRSAPFTVFFVLLLYLAGEPGGLFSHPFTQLALLAAAFLRLKLNCFSAAFIAACLYFQQWHITSVVFTLTAAPLLSAAQLRQFSLVSAAAVTAVLVSGLVIIKDIDLGVVRSVEFSYVIEYVSALVISVLFGASLLRLGPRKFIGQPPGFKKQARRHQG